ncbi:MAG: glycosyltransferase family 87 protein, partial [Isosphaeraceae bacterium]
MPWYPLQSWPNERRWIWATIAFWLVILRGPAFVENLQARPPSKLVPDFFQEYASARCWLEGKAVYGDYHESVRRYLGGHLDDRRSHFTVNAHPPASVLLALPFAKTNFPKAFLAWNLVSLAALAASLWIVQKQLKIPLRASSLAPLVALPVLCYPLWEHCRLGQLTLILLLFVTGAWAAERSGRPLLAGVLLGTATSIKLFPAFLLIYYALRCRWRVVAGGFLTIGALFGLSSAILGFEAHRTYFTSVLPSIQWFRVGWDNNSVWGFWSRLFDPAPEHVRDRALTEPLFYSSTLAVALSLVSSAAITAALAWAVRRDATGRKSDLTFALAVVAMLLVSPICWDHYLLLLLVPLAVVWIELPATWFARTLLLVVVATFWLGY